MENHRAKLDPTVFSIADLKREAIKKLDKQDKSWAVYYNEGAMDLLTLKENEEAFNRYKICPRVFVPVANMDTTTTLFGQTVPLPFGFSPSASHQLAHPDGELATSRAAAKFGIGMCLSAYSNTPLEDVIAEGIGNPFGIHICMMQDREIAAQIIKRAEACGYKAVLLSVDTPVLGLRLGEMRTDFNLPPGLTHPNIVPSEKWGKENPGKIPTLFDNTMDWPSTIAWLKTQTKLQVWLKGVMTPEDVSLSIRYGADGIIISNHGGRQLDGCPSTLDSLRVCAPIAAGKIPIAVDGGIRRGSDIFKALALGANFCFLGRVPIWGLAYNGQTGVELALHILAHEFKNTMALAGCRTLSEISKHHLAVLDSKQLLCRL